MKKMGVIGGIGPQATMDFEQRVHKVSQQLIPQMWSSSYPTMFVYFHRSAPMKMNADFTPVEPMQADPDLLEAAKNISKLVDFMVMTSNTPHLFLDEIQTAVSCPFLSILEATTNEVQRRGWQNVGILEIGDPIVYPPQIEKLNLTYKIADTEIRKELGEVIRSVFEGKNGVAETAVAQKAIHNLRQKGVDGIIMGCTEIPLLLPEAERDQPDLINPAQLLAETAVKFAIST